MYEQGREARRAELAEKKRIEQLYSPELSPLALAIEEIKDRVNRELEEQRIEFQRYMLKKDQEDAARDLIILQLKKAVEKTIADVVALNMELIKLIK